MKQRKKSYLASYVFCFVKNVIVLNEMPFRKANNYSRFNVGEYMRQKRLGWVAVDKKNKSIKNAAQKLKRLDTKVRNVLTC